MIIQMRIVPLTPMLPLAITDSDKWSWRRLFLAFKAASIVLAKIQADVTKFSQNPPDDIAAESRRFPSVTEINSVNHPGSTRVKFKILSRYDQVEHHHLYLAELAEGQQIYVKFTQRYSRELHSFCAKRGLAPKLLGFELLPGGWFAVAMEKVDTVQLGEIESISGFDRWKRDIRELVGDFHDIGLVHGDLRLVNFVFTGSKPCRLILVDFDWGGKEGEVYFPRGDLSEDLYADEAQRLCLDRPITKKHDDWVLARMFQKLDEIVAERGATPLNPPIT